MYLHETIWRAAYSRARLLATPGWVRHSKAMLLLYTDFGYAGPYVGQMHAVLATQAPGLARIDLMHDAPAFNPLAAGHLLAALSLAFPARSTCLAVIDPGVGGPRRPLALQAGGHWFVGPDNSLLNPVAARLGNAGWHEITWRPDELSSSFHGRDLFAPVAAALAQGKGRELLQPITPPPGSVDPGNLAEVIYIDGFGNAITGLVAETVAPDSQLEISGQLLGHADHFCEREPGEAFWYENSMGLIEVAINQGHAAQSLKLSVGSKIKLLGQ